MIEKSIKCKRDKFKLFKLFNQDFLFRELAMSLSSSGIHTHEGCPVKRQGRHRRRLYTVKWNCYANIVC